jgi:excisionase family DNA binding protein
MLPWVLYYKYLLSGGFTMSQLTYTVKEAAKELKVSTLTMYRLIHTKEFPVIWVGRRAVIPAAGFDEWLETKTGSKVKTHVHKEKTPADD